MRSARRIILSLVLFSRAQTALLIGANEVDFEKAAAVALTDGARHEGEVGALIDTLDAKAIPAALFRLDRLPDQSRLVIDLMRTRLARRWVETDGAEAMRYAEQRPDGFKRFALLKEVVSVWTKSNLDAAAAWVRNAPAGFAWDEIVQMVVKALVERDPVAAVRFAESTKPLVLPRGAAGQRDRIWQLTFRQWGERDAPAAAEFARKLPESQRRLAAILTALTEWLAKDSSAAWAWLRELPELHRDFISDHFFREYADRDPPGAAQAVLGLSAPLQSVAARQVGSTLAFKNLPAAMAFAAKLPEGKAREVVLGEVGQRLLEADHTDAAATFALKMPASPSRDDLLRLVAMRMARSDPTGAVAWVQQLPAGPARNVALDWTMTIWSETDPRAAAEFLLTVPTADWFKYPQFELARKLASGDPHVALAWVKRLPASADAKLTTGVVIEEWARTDPEAARKFALTAPISDSRSYFLAQVARGWSDHKPQEALRLAEQLPPGDLREETLTYIRQRAPPQYPKRHAEPSKR